MGRRCKDGEARPFGLWALDWGGRGGGPSRPRSSSFSAQRDFFAGYEATVDWPAAPFWSEISAAFPEALIVLSVRDADDWWRSASNTIFVALATYFGPDAPDDGWTRMGRGMMTTFTRRRVARLPPGVGTNPLAQDVRTGRAFQPRTTEESSSAPSTSTSQSGNRLSTSSRAIRPSSRARAAPRQKWMP